ncbi:Tudor-SN, partial [Symbiodinium sp. KB8]
MGAAKKGSLPPEMQVSLASLKAPRPSRHPEQTDEPFAFQSREFLRELLVGKAVRFEVEYKVDTINRSFAALYLDSANVNEMVARAGWAKVMEVDDPAKQKCSKVWHIVGPHLAQQQRGVCLQHYEELVRLSADAQKEKRGIYQEITDESEAVRHMNWEVDNPSKLLGEIKGVPVPALIEIVGTGSVYRVYLPKQEQWITMVLAGVVCPKMKGKPVESDDGESKSQSYEPEPFAREAKHFVEARLLQRDINVIINGTDKFNVGFARCGRRLVALLRAKFQNFLGVVDHPKGNIAVELLKHGYGKMADWSVGKHQRTVFFFAGPTGLFVLGFVEDKGAVFEMRNAERTAKLQRLRLWQGFVPSASKLSGAKKFEGTVVE